MPPPLLNHRGHCWVGVGVKYNSKSPPPCHHLLTFHNLYCAVSLPLSLETVATKIASNPGIAGDAPYFNCNRLNINNAVTSSILEGKQIVYLRLRC